MSTGLEMYAFIPESGASCMSSEKTLAVMAITGIIPMSTNPEHQVQIYGPDVPIRILGKVVEVKFKI